MHIRVVVAAAALAASGAHAASAPVVPVSVQQAIAKRARSLAYVPARIAIGYRYRSWEHAPGHVYIHFRNRAGKEITFAVERRTAPCTRGKDRTFQMAGNKVYWGLNDGEQESWRCIGSVKLSAATEQPPTKFGDVGLGRVAASGHRIR